MYIFLVNPFPHTTNLQQATLKTSGQKTQIIPINEKNKMENIMAKGEIACFEQFILLS